MKYKALAMITSYFLFMTYFINAFNGTTPNNPITSPDGEPPSGILDALGGVLEYLRTFWDIMTFQIPNVGFFVSLTFIVCALVMFLIIISLIRGTD